jgi:hypothetical protein
VAEIRAKDTPNLNGAAAVTPSNKKPFPLTGRLESRRWAELIGGLNPATLRKNPSRAIRTATTGIMQLKGSTWHLGLTALCLGVGLLGYLLARAANTDYETLLRERITCPLRMNDTMISLALSPDIDVGQRGSIFSNRCFGHE